MCYINWLRGNKHGCKLQNNFDMQKNMLVHTMTLAAGEAEAGDLKFEVRGVT